MRNYILINLSLKGIKAKHQNKDLSERLNHVQLPKSDEFEIKKSITTTKKQINAVIK